MAPLMPTIEASHLKRRPAAEKEKVREYNSSRIYWKLDMSFNLLINHALEKLVKYIAYVI
jgi:hypothetical protein